VNLNLSNVSSGNNTPAVGSARNSRLASGSVSGSVPMPMSTPMGSVSHDVSGVNSRRESHSGLGVGVSPGGSRAHILNASALSETNLSMSGGDSQQPTPGVPANTPAVRSMQNTPKVSTGAGAIPIGQGSFHRASASATGRTSQGNQMHQMQAIQEAVEQLHAQQSANPPTSDGTMTPPSGSGAHAQVAVDSPPMRQPSSGGAGVMKANSANMNKTISNFHE